MPDARHYRFGTFSLDTQTRELHDGDDAPVALTAKAFDTLCLLIAHRDRIVGKDELLATVWAGRVVEENNLTQAIAALRRALGTNAGEHRYILTVPGRGYRFVAELRDNDPAVSPAAGPRRPQRPLAITIGAALFAAALVGLAAWQLKKPAAPVTAQTAALAVLPFRPLAGGPRDELLELGLADSLITRVSRSNNLRVRSLASSQQFAGAKQDPIEAGRDLGADYIVEGTIQRHGGRVRVTSRLLSVRDGTALWSGTFDETPDHVFTLQDRIADALATALAVKFATPARSSPCDGADADAYRAYLSGQYELARPSALRTRRALDGFRRAIDLDPTCARAYAGMANAYRILAMVADAEPGEVFPLAKAMAAKALALDPELAEAHVAQGWIRLWHDWDWTASETSFRRAIELNPSLANAYFGYANLLKQTGRDAEAAQQAKLALALDPLSPVINAIGGWFDLDPEYWLALLLRGVGRIGAGDMPAGLADLEQARQICGDCSHALTTLGMVKARTGDADAARAILRGMEARDREGYWPASSLASLHNALGETDAALDLLERAYRERDVRMSFLVIDMSSRWNNLRAQPRFRALAQQMKLPEGATPAIRTNTPASANTSAADRSSR
jgi:DNA-binding winged helix-turn-helix (wHTH) protein/TolB-like protein